MVQVPMTCNGFKTLCMKLQKLKDVDRPRLVKSVALARSFGDLKENSEYHTAVEEQIFLEKKIELLEFKIRNSLLIDVLKYVNDGRVIFGSSVVLQDLYSMKIMKYIIVGTDEANLKERKISICSPIAKSFINRFKNEIVHLKVPKGLIAYKIIEVIYE